jgi:GNAT superfamily N-acetyltransferase
MSIEYKEINGEMVEKIINEFDCAGDGWIEKYNKLGNGAFGLTAVDSDVPVGYIIVTPRALTFPLEHLKDAYIEIYEVQEDYQRRGIGQTLATRAEEWARKAGFRQIRTHHNDKAVAAIHMSHKLGYSMCPHVFYNEEGCAGYWVAKVL